MKKRFIFKVMYGDADGYETFKYITDNEDEINFLTYFLENYTEDLFDFYDRPDLLHYNKTFKNDEESLIEIVNNFISLENKFKDKESKLLSEYASKEEIHEALSEVIWVINEYIGWFMYHSGMDYNGCPESYEIEDITDCVEMTKKEVIEMMKDKLGINVVITD